MEVILIDIVIRNTGEQPIYEQIYTQIKNQIVSGVLQPGEALPSIRNLAKDLRISVITTKRAYEELERDGFIETVTGKGSFVAAQNAELLREEALRRTEQALRGAVDTARQGGVTDSEVREMLELVLEGE